MKRERELNYTDEFELLPKQLLSDYFQEKGVKVPDVLLNSYSEVQQRFLVKMFQDSFKSISTFSRKTINIILSIDTDNRSSHMRTIDFALPFLNHLYSHYEANVNDDSYPLQLSLLMAASHINYIPIYLSDLPSIQGMSFVDYFELNDSFDDFKKIISEHKLRISKAWDWIETVEKMSNTTENYNKIIELYSEWLFRTSCLLVPLYRDYRNNLIPYKNTCFLEDYDNKHKTFIKKLVQNKDNINITTSISDDLYCAYKNMILVNKHRYSRDNYIRWYQQVIQLMLHNYLKPGLYLKQLQDFYLELSKLYDGSTLACQTYYILSSCLNGEKYRPSINENNFFNSSSDRKNAPFFYYNSLNETFENLCIRIKNYEHGYIDLAIHFCEAVKIFVSHKDNPNFPKNDFNNYINKEGNSIMWLKKTHDLESHLSDYFKYMHEQYAAPESLLSYSL